MRRRSMSEVVDDHVMLLLPGRMLGPHVPLLAYAGEAGAARGARVVPCFWPEHPEPVTLNDDTATRVQDLVRMWAEACRDETPGVRLVAVAKSLSTLATPVLADLEIPAVLLTPVLTSAVGHLDPTPVLVGVRHSKVPVLLVGGTADELWDGEVARELAPHVLEVVGADHAMMLPGPLSGSAAVLGQVARAIENFLDVHVWGH
jgi:hypothetical protein